MLKVTQHFVFHLIPVQSLQYMNLKLKVRFLTKKVSVRFEFLIVVFLKI